MNRPLSRRGFLGTAAAAAGFGLAPGVLLVGREARADTPQLTFQESLVAWWLQNALFDPASLFQFEAVFEESYVVRAALRASELAAPLDQTALLRGAFAFADRVVSNQGLQGYPYSLYQGYGLSPGGNDLSLVADQSAIANAVLECCSFAEDPSTIAGWQQCIINYVEWVTSSFITNDPVNGIAYSSAGIGVATNPYWCATALFTTTLYKLARFTDPGQQYSLLAGRGLEWLSTFSWQDVDIFSSTPACVILYTMDGLVDGITFLQDNGQTSYPVYQTAINQFSSMASWLVANQTTDGRWAPDPIPDPSSSVPLYRTLRGYSAALAWQLLQMNRRLSYAYPEWAACAQNSLNYMMSSTGEAYYGLFNRPFETGLALLSFTEDQFS